MKSQQTIAGYFRGKNYFTPEVIRYGQAGEYFYELSTGAGLDGKPIYGVTVANKKWGHVPQPEHELSDLFFNLIDAEAYIKSLAK